MEIRYKFKAEELKKDLTLIGETFSMGSKPTKTGRGKRLYAEMIPTDMEEDAQMIITKGKHAFTNGLREDIELTSRQILVLKKLVNYCLAL